MRETEVKRTLRTDLSAAQKLQIADEMTTEMAALETTRQEKTSADQIFKGRIERHIEAVGKLASAYRLGYRMDVVECKVMFNSPEVRERTVVRLDTGEVCAVEPMSQDELQEEFEDWLASQTPDERARLMPPPPQPTDQCAAENYIASKGDVGEYERCAEKGELCTVAGLLAGSEARLCAKHRAYFTKAGYEVTISSGAAGSGEGEARAAAVGESPKDLRSSLPSSEDLDAHAEENRIREALDSPNADELNP